MQLRSIHPFPARMAPELALKGLGTLPKGSIVLDPMAGSGTVVRQAIDLGHKAIGFDVDPLAVLMSKVWTTPIDDFALQKFSEQVLAESLNVDLRSSRLPWVQEDPATADFIAFWFAPMQRRALHRIAYVLHARATTATPAEQAALDVMRLALSRIIVTKEQAASLARDTSHSRPHRVSESSDFDVFKAYRRSVSQLRSRLAERPPLRRAKIRLGDARKLGLRDESVDAVMTSPPYLNAIDYLRGHRMSLVWLGHKLDGLRDIRGTSIGAERGAEAAAVNDARIADVAAAMIGTESLSSKHDSMIRRYANDLILMTAEVRRVLKPNGRATFVVGNSCLKGAFITNSAGVAAAAHLAGMHEISVTERALPASSRYLPITPTGALGKRMRTEIVLTFAR